jgi:hypothetical protein
MSLRSRSSAAPVAVVVVSPAYHSLKTLSSAALWLIQHQQYYHVGYVLIEYVTQIAIQQLSPAEQADMYAHLERAGLRAEVAHVGPLAVISAAASQLGGAQGEGGASSSSAAAFLGQRLMRHLMMVQPNTNTNNNNYSAGLAQRMMGLLFANNNSNATAPVEGDDVMQRGLFALVGEAMRAVVGRHPLLPNILLETHGREAVSAYLSHGEAEGGNNNQPQKKNGSNGSGIGKPPPADPHLAGPKRL